MFGLFRFPIKNACKKDISAIFFDVDGVLNCKSDWKVPFSLNHSCLDAFAELCKELSYPNLIISSTWRAGMSDKGNDSPQMEYLTSALKIKGLHISDTTPVSNNKTREQEIDYYARRHNISRFLVLDDDPSLFDTPSKLPLYLTDYATGMIKSDIYDIIKLLNRFYKGQQEDRLCY